MDVRPILESSSRVLDAQLAVTEVGVSGRARHGLNPWHRALRRPSGAQQTTCKRQHRVVSHP